MCVNFNLRQNSCNWTFSKIKSKSYICKYWVVLRLKYFDEWKNTLRSKIEFNLLQKVFAQSFRKNWKQMINNSNVRWIEYLINRIMFKHVSIKLCMLCIVFNGATTCVPFHFFCFSLYTVSLFYVSLLHCVQSRVTQFTLLFESV